MSSSLMPYAKLCYLAFTDQLPNATSVSYAMYYLQVLAKEFPWLSFDSLPEVWWYSHPEFPNDAIKMAFNSTEPLGEWFTHL